MPAFALTRTLRANAKSLSRESQVGDPAVAGRRAAVDRHVGHEARRADRPASSSRSRPTGDFQICELMPELAKQMKHLSIVRSMSTREADHDRGRYYMHTGYVPNPSVEHPSYGSVIAHEMESKLPELEIPPFVSIGGASEGPGFLGMAYAPFQVDANGHIRDADMSVPVAADERSHEAARRAGDALHRRAARHGRRGARQGAHEDAGPADQRADEGVQGPQRDRRTCSSSYGDNNFGRGCLMARRLVEVGVPFVEVELGRLGPAPGLLHVAQEQAAGARQGVQPRWSTTSKQRGLLDSTVVLCMGEFGRTPRINGNSGRDHFARAWSVVLGGAAIKGGRAIGKTNADGTSVETDPYSSEDLMATVCHALGISLETTYTTPSGRPMKIANGGKVIQELFA